MPSIGFKKRSYRGGPPPVCTKPPIGGPLVPPGKPAWKLHAYAKWYSEITNQESDQTRNLEIPWNPITNQYHGPIRFQRPMLRITAYQSPTDHLWTIILLCWDVFLNGKAVWWEDLDIDMVKHFDSGLLHHTFPGASNKQEVRLTL